MASVRLVVEPPRSVLDGHSFLVLAVHPTLADLVVNHDGVHVTVSEHALEHVVWHAALGHICSKRMTKCMGMHARGPVNALHCRTSILARARSFSGSF